MVDQQLMYWIELTFDFEFNFILTPFLISFDPSKPADRALHVGAAFYYKIYEKILILKK